MSKKKACKLCRMFIEGEECPNCRISSFTTTWKGRLMILNPEKSVIAQKIGVTKKGEYAIKIR